MRLLNCRTRQLCDFTYPPPVPYAILSHTWSSPHDDEWSYYDSPNSTEERTRHEIVVKVCNLSQDHGLEFVWVDNECIDKSSSTEVSEAINSLPKYFRGATICFAFLVDLPCGDFIPCKDTWARCQFWTRAWTLQELILPSKVQFYDAQWHLRGDRSSQPLHSLISGITGIDEEVLNHQRTLKQTSVARKMSWAAWRISSSPEDVAYSLLGIFDVCMPIILGEGKRRSFRRLLEEIIKHNNDGSMFAWTGLETDGCRGLLANSPNEFLSYARQVSGYKPLVFQGFTLLTSRGVLVSGQFSMQGDNLLLHLGVEAEEENRSTRHGILLKQRHDATFARVNASEIQESVIDTPNVAMQVMVYRGQVEEVLVNDNRFHYTDSDANATSCNESSSACEAEQPFTPNQKTELDDKTSSDVTPTGSDPSLDRQLHKDEPDWISVSESQFGVILSDDSEDDCPSMEVSQHTDPGWPRPNSMLSIRTTVTSPSNTEFEFTPQNCLPCSRQNDDDYSDAQEDLEMEALHHYDATKTHIVAVLLDQFSNSQRRVNCLRKQGANRYRVSKRQSGNEHKMKSWSPAQTRISPLSAGLACPYYLQNRRKHVACFINCDLGDMEDVKDHLWQFHRLPYFCPTCKTKFRYSSENDEHINERTCQFQKYMPYEGVSEDQYWSISRIQNVGDVKKEWNMIWGILFSDSPTPMDPCTRTPRDRRIADLKSFWQRRGSDLLSECLDDRFSTHISLDHQTLEDLSSDVLCEAGITLLEKPGQSSDIRSSTDTLSTGHTWTEAEI